MEIKLCFSQEFILIFEFLTFKSLNIMFSTKLVVEPFRLYFLFYATNIAGRTNGYK